jgi:putative nucleotidyltransferase with HDIG domain
MDTDHIFEDITAHLISDNKPSLYIEELDKQGYFTKYPLSMLHKLKDAEQSPKYHPEGSAWNHTMMVLDEAAKAREKSRNKEVFMWSALLHDIGKPPTTRNRKGKITSYDHDKVGEDLCIEFLQYYNCELDFIDSVASMVRYHMHMLYVLKKLPFADMKGLLKRVDIYELALLCLCDRLGRTGADHNEEEKEYTEFKQVLSKLTK